MAMKRVFGNFLAAVSKEMKKDVAKFDWTNVDDKFDWRKMREIGGEGLATFDWKKMVGVGAQEIAKVLKPPEERQETSVKKLPKQCTCHFLLWINKEIVILERLVIIYGIILTEKWSWWSYIIKTNVFEFFSSTLQICLKSIKL